RFEALEAAVEDAESAWEEGRLHAALANGDLVARLGEELAATYSRLLRPGHLGPAPFRRKAVRALLDAGRSFLAAPCVCFPAVAVWSDELTADELTAPMSAMVVERSRQKVSA